MQQQRSREQLNGKTIWHGADSVEENLNCAHGERPILYATREASQKFAFLGRATAVLSNVLPLVLQNQEMKLVAVHIFKTQGREIIRDPVGARLLQLGIRRGGAQTEHARTG